MQNPSHPSPSHGSDADGSDADGSDVPPPTADAPRTMADGMALLHEVIASLSEALSPEDVARIVAERVRGAIGADSAFVATLAQERGLPSSQLPDDVEGFVRSLMYDPSV